MISSIKNFFTESLIHRQIVKNVSWLFVAEIGSRIVRGFLAIIAARMLGASGYGQFVYVLALGGIIMLLQDAGVNMFLTRELSKKPSEKNALLFTSLLIEVVVVGIGILAFLLLGPWISNIPEASYLIPIVAIIFITDFMQGFFFAITRAEQNMRVESIIKVIGNILVVICGVVFMILNPNPFSLAQGYAVGGIIALFSIGYYVRNYFPWKKFVISKKIIRELFTFSWPFVLISLSGIVITNTDTLLLGQFATSAEVGYYGAANRLIQLTYILPALFASATFPVFVHKIVARQSFRSGVKKSLVIVGGGAILCTIFFALGASLLIPLIFGSEYRPAIEILIILAFTCIPVFITAIFNYIIYAINEHKRLIIINVLGVIVSIILNVILVPKLLGTGAAIATLLSFLFIMIGTLIQAGKLASLNNFVK